MRAKKSFGQHFLINESLAESIVDKAIGSADQLPILEVGPGKGVLTKYLIDKEANFKAIDADQDMIHFLENNMSGIAEKLILNDVLKQDFDTIFDQSEFYVLGNFPYNISSQIVFKIIKNRHLIPGMTGMFQKEVADRIIADHGSKIYGVLSVLIQVFYEGKIVHKVSAGSFSPPPKVDSAVVQLSRRKVIPDVDYSFFRHVVKASFAQRRKMMRNTLKSTVKQKDLLKDPIFEKRPEHLSVESFIDLTNRIQQSNYEFDRENQQ